MPNKWVDHVKEYSKLHGVSYTAALKDPACKESYKKSSNKSEEKRERKNSEEKESAEKKHKKIVN